MFIWGYLHNKLVFCYKFMQFSLFIKTFFLWLVLKIEFVIFMHKLINYNQVQQFQISQPARQSVHKITPYVYCNYYNVRPKTVNSD